MSDQDEIELTEAFKELTAPRSTANYAQRTPAVEVRSTGSHWPQALASVLAVVVAIAGAGTFLALRNARQTNLATAAGGNPPARSGAAMAYDSTAGVTVMYGGTGAAGSPLRDTWLWRGTAWSPLAQSGGPGPMVDVRMSDDPHDGGVLLIGMPELAVANGSGSSISGCVIGATGSGTANAGTATTGPPLSATGALGASGTATSAVPSVATPGSVPPATPTVPRASPCPEVITPSVQTWIFDASGWHRVDVAANAVAPAASAQVAYDPASGDVVAVATTYYPCGAPLATGTTKQPQIACESPLASGTASSSGTGSTGSSASAAPQVCTVKACPIRTVPCPLSSVIYSCGGGASVSTWVWSGGHWTTRSSNAPASVDALVTVSGADGQHAKLVVETGAPLPGCQGLVAPCAATPSLSSPDLEIWQWTSSGWESKMTGLAQNGLAQNGRLTLVGSAVASVDGRVVAVAADGSARTLDLTTGVIAAAGSITARVGEAFAQGPAGTVVLFGGIAISSGTAVSSSLPSGMLPGSDTWTWNPGAGWQHLAGSVPPPPTPCPSAPKTGPGCVEILPAQVPPGTPAATSGSSTPAAVSNGLATP
jgi:hypothetical protein